MGMPMKAGFARTDITPPYSVPLAGYGNTMYRMSQSVLDPLLASCVAVSDGDTAVLFFHLDLCVLPYEMVEFCQAALEERLGIPRTQIFMTATHSHSAPDLLSNMPCI